MHLRVLGLGICLIVALGGPGCTGTIWDCGQSISDALEAYSDKTGDVAHEDISTLCNYLEDSLSNDCITEFQRCPEKEAATNERNLHEREKRSSQKRHLGWNCDEPAAECQGQSNALYRTIDGSCNNLNVGRWEWGRANRIQNRLLLPKYEDGLSSFRRTTPFGPLPNAREVSNVMHVAGPQIEHDPTRSMFIMQMGQFLSHDVVLSKAESGLYGGSLDCCGADIENPICAPIRMPENEPFFPPSACMNFTRTKARMNCQTGLLKSIGQNLPRDKADSTCTRSQPIHPVNYYCPKSGDPRVAETSGLTSLHTLWLRNHNWLASGLAAIHLDWDDETLFQEARRINIALWQHIVYNEYLPAVMGQATLIAYDMDVASSGYKDTYSPNVDATIINSFGAAVLRYGHSLVSRNLGQSTLDDGSTIIEEPIQNTFFEPKLYFTHGHRGTDNILKYTSVKRSAQSDRILEPSVQRFLFNKNLDLAALNIHRGRDHGLPGYNDFREYCGLHRAYDFSTGPDGLEDHTQQNADLMSQVYSHPDQIDLFTGFLSEKHLPDSQLGPTGQCIFALMFKRLRDGDRFFYERKTNSPDITFTLAQLAEIKSVTMSSLLCINTEDTIGKKIQENMFFMQSPSNDFVNCSDVHGIDLSIF